MFFKKTIFAFTDFLIYSKHNKSVQNYYVPVYRNLSRECIRLSLLRKTFLKINLGKQQARIAWQYT